MLICDRQNSNGSTGDAGTDKQLSTVLGLILLKEDESVAQKALVQIEEAEAAAEKIRSDAAQKAEEIRSDAHLRGKVLLAESSAAARDERKRLLTEAEAKAAQILADAGVSAKEAADRLTVETSGKLDAASALILERIRELWQ